MPGARSQFKVMKKNPNTGGGCLCSPDSKVVDCQGPYAVGTHKEQFVSRNPYVVIGAGCTARMNAKINGEPEPEQIEVPVPVSGDDVERVLASATVAELSTALHAQLTATAVGEPVQGS